MQNKYNWNEHNVCTNPDVHNFDTPTHYIRINTAFDGGLWFSGHDVFSKRGSKYFGSFSPVSRISNKLFNDENQAIRYELRLFLGWWDLPETVKKVIREHLANLSQLSLF